MKDLSTAAAELDQHTDGPVLLPGDAGYGEELAGFNLAIEHSPDLVVGAANAADVVKAVRFARERGLPIGVHSTGHSETPITSGLVVVTRRLDKLEIDAATGIATLGAGLQWDAVIAAAAEHGLAPIAGSSPKVGVAGYLLGGGLGPLARSHGYSSDYVTGMTVVTGAGELIETEDDPELLWALRGGKTGLGVVTEVRVRLVELESLYAGSLFFAEEDIDAALSGWIDWTATADPHASTSAAIVRFPAFDAVPEPLRGRRLLTLRFAYPGPASEGEPLAAPLREIAPVYLDMVGDLPPAQIARVHNDPSDPGTGWARGILLTHADQGLAAALAGQAGAGTDLPFVVVELRHLGAATTIDVPEGSAAGGRSAAFTLTAIGVDPALMAVELPAAFDRLVAAVGVWASPETNVNFAGRPRSAEDYANAWPARTRARLDAARATYDPDGLLAYPI